MDHLQNHHRVDPNMRLVADIWNLLRGHRIRFFLASFLELTRDLVWLYPAYALASIVNFLGTYSVGDSLSPLWLIAFLWALVSFWHYGVGEISNYLGYQIAERSALDAQLKTIRHLLRLDLSWHEKENSGNKLKRIQKGGEGIDSIMRIWFLYVIQITVNLVGMVFILAMFDLLIALFVSLFIISYFFFSRYFTIKSGNAALQVNIGEEDLQGIVFEVINNVRSVKVLGMHKSLLSIIEKRINTLFEKIRYRIGWYRMRAAVMHSWAQFFRLGITFFIAWGVIEGHYEIGFLVLYFTYFNYVWTSIEELSDVSLDFVVARYGVSRMVDILNEEVHIDVEDGKLEFPKNWKQVKVRNLSFSYGDLSVLHNISFNIQRGEKVGIVGVSGAGKSTLFKLLLKEYENYTGEILIDDVPLKNISRKSYFQHSAVVLQDTEVFNFRLCDNITLSNVEESENKTLLHQSIKIAHVTDFMQRLPQGLDTFIGEKGVKLSGGERQRLGIARAVFKKPDILFLDEATSHLDIESEEKIQDSLHRFFQDVTAVVIAHRLSTIKEMNRIIVIEHGKIVEEGSFEELYKKKGRFYELWEKQKF